ncbi:MAG: DUF554 domain-containing protein [Calditrichaceae bacterium]
MGTVINVITVLIGSAIGYFLRSKFSDSLRQQMLYGIGLVTILLGIQMGLKTENILIPLGGLLLGGIFGHFIKVDKGLENFAAVLKNRFADKIDGNGNFMEGFITASLIFCVGPMTILGSINDGLNGDYQLLAIKSVLDGFTSVALTASLGIGVGFSIITIIIVQGGFTLSAYYLSSFFSEEIINETTAVGGLIIIGLGILILDIKKINIANFLPAIFITPLIVKIMRLFL